MYTKKAREKANELKQSNETSDQRQIRQVQRELDQDKTKTTWKKKRSCQLRRPRFELKYTHSSTCLCQQVNQDLPPDIITQIPTLVFVNPVPPTAQDANEFGADDEQPINEEDSWRTRTPLEDERSHDSGCTVPVGMHRILLRGIPLQYRPDNPKSSTQGGAKFSFDDMVPSYVRGGNIKK